MNSILIEKDPTVGQELVIKPKEVEYTEIEETMEAPQTDIETDSYITNSEADEGVSYAGTDNNMPAPSDTELQKQVQVLEKRLADKDSYIETLKKRVESQDAIIQELQSAVEDAESFFSKSEDEVDVEMFSQTREKFTKATKTAIQSKLRAIGTQLDLTSEEAIRLNEIMSREWGDKVDNVIKSTSPKMLHSWVKEQLNSIRKQPTKLAKPVAQADNYMNSLEQTISDLKRQVEELSSITKTEVKRTSTPVVTRKTALVPPRSSNSGNKEIVITGKIAV